MDPEQIRDNLKGPIASVRTPFQKDGSIDYEGLRTLIDAAIAGTSRTILLTAGDSHYECLSDEEIAEVTRVTCRHTANRAMVVAADRYYSTDRAIAFARFVKSVGADVVMSLPPDWAGSCTAAGLAEHYAAVAKYVPVMIVTNRFIPRGVAFGLETLRLALERSDRIVAVKDDMCGEFAQKMCLLAHERCAVFAGGQKRNHMNMWPFGCDGYLSVFVTFKPEITQRYWSAIEVGDVATASAVVAEYDIPLFDFIGRLPGGFDAGMHGMLELYGLAKRWRRKPYHSLTDQQMEQLAEFLQGRGLL